MRDSFFTKTTMCILMILRINPCKRRLHLEINFTFCLVRINTALIKSKTMTVIVMHHQADFSIKSWGIGIDTVMLEPNMLEPNMFV